MAIETGVVLDLDNKPIFWHCPQNRGTAILPDSRELWDVIWENRANISGFAHTHPFHCGAPAPSGTDITTFIAIEKALGKRLDWWILSLDNVCLVKWLGPDEKVYVRYTTEGPEPEWAVELRKLSELSET